jgi:hypothetical protein
MKAVLCLSGTVLVVLCAVWAYRVNYATQDAQNRVAGLRAAIAHERETLAVLRAEWAYLNRPDRLAVLVDRHAEALGLAPLTPEHFADPAMIAFPQPPADLVPVSGEPE